MKYESSIHLGLPSDCLEPTVQTREQRQLRSHPMIIKWCLNLKFLSSGAYGALRSVLSLPSERTLRDYTHWIDSSPGFHADVDKQLMDEAKIKSFLISESMCASYLMKFASKKIWCTTSTHLRLLGSSVLEM